MNKLSVRQLISKAWGSLTLITQALMEPSTNDVQHEVIRDCLIIDDRKLSTVSCRYGIIVLMLDSLIHRVYKVDLSF